MAGGIALAVALSVVPAARAEIVYVHGSGVGSTLMAMNDDGSGPHVLLAPGSVAPNDQLAYPAVAPNGSELVFQGITDEFANLNGPPGDDGANYGGLYTLSGGVVTRLSAAPAPVANAGSEDTSPAVTADGRVVYEALSLTYYSDGSGLSGSNEQLLVRPLSGGAPSAWPTAPQTSYGRTAADPVDGGLIAYTTEPPIQLIISGPGGVGAAVVASQPSGFNPAFSPDGTQLVDVDWTPSGTTGTGYSAGIWVFGAQAGATGREVLADPSPPSSGAGTFNNPIFAGAGEIVFQATVSGATNLYEVPTSCNACAFPGPGVTQLTSDGTASAPDSEPAWTAQTITELGQGTPAAGGGAGTAPAGPGAGAPGGPSGGTGGGHAVDEVTGAGVQTASGGRLLFRVRLKTAATITIEIMRRVPARGHGRHRHKAHHVVLGTLTFHGRAGLNRLHVSKVHRHHLAPGSYEAEIVAGGAPHVVRFKVPGHHHRRR